MHFMNKILNELHWLLVRLRVTFQLPTLSFKVQSTEQTSYLASLIMHHVPGSVLHSVSEELLAISRILATRHSATCHLLYGKLYHYQLGKCKTQWIFRKHLKTYLFTLNSNLNRNRANAILKNLTSYDDIPPSRTITTCQLRYPFQKKHDMMLTAAISNNVEAGNFLAVVRLLCSDERDGCTQQ